MVCAQAPAKLPALAVLVQAKPGGEALADQLRPLLEAEVSRYWEGGLVERTNIDRLLKDLNRVVTANVPPMQFGVRYLGSALIYILVFPDHIQLFLTGVPGAEAIFDKIYRDRLDAASLATRIASDVLTGLRWHRKDALIPSVAIGPTFCVNPQNPHPVYRGGKEVTEWYNLRVDPHPQFLAFGRGAETALRARLTANPDIHQVDRLFPSDLLHVATAEHPELRIEHYADFAAPPADVLVYAECHPQANQDLTAPAAMLECTITVLAPTNLFQTLQETFPCAANMPDTLADHAQRLTEKAVGLAADALFYHRYGGIWGPNFNAMKQLSFRLMPNPPRIDYAQHSGNLQISTQLGTPDELTCALRMLECVLLSKGDDTQLLVCAGVVIDRMASSGTMSAGMKNALFECRRVLFERAYYLESNENTCKFYADCFLAGSTTEPTPPALKAARQILNTRENGNWSPSSIERARLLLNSTAPSTDAQLTRIMQDTADEQNKWALGTIGQYLTPYVLPKTNDAITESVLAASNRHAELLIRSDSPIFQYFGHLFAVQIACRREEQKTPTDPTRDGTAHVQAILALLPELNAHAHLELHSLMSNPVHDLGRLISEYAALLEKRGVPFDKVALLEPLISQELAISVLPTDTIRELVTELQKRNQPQRALDLLTNCINQYKGQFVSDVARMQLVNEYNRLFFQLNKTKPLRLSQLTKVSFPDQGHDADEVTKLVASPFGIFGRSQVSGDSTQGRVFLLRPHEAQITLLPQVKSASVLDLACTPRYLGVVTDTDGLILIDGATLTVRQCVSGNAALPNAHLRVICAVGDSFGIGVPVHENRFLHLYLLNPETQLVTDTGLQLIFRTGVEIVASQGGKFPVSLQSWFSRFKLIEGQCIELRYPNTFNAINTITVSTKSGEVLLKYHGFEMNYVNDFTCWQGYLVLATGNGLYISRPGTNTIRCLLSEPDLSLLSCCLVDDRLYLGTSKGLYILDAATFKASADR